MSEPDIQKLIGLAQAISKRDQCDIFLYNGEIERGEDLNFIENVYENQEYEKCRLILVTSGGDPDAAYKMARYVQERYKRFEILLAGLCKSAGTLIAIGAHELIFTPYGELGPLDVQIAKEDKLSGLQSGLNISAALQSMETSAVKAYLRLIGDIMKSSNGIVSFQTASKSASEVLDALYGPIFSRIDPEDVGSRTRSMRIAADYGKRLNALSNNMKEGAVEKLAETYPSHGFVIDMTEAQALFKSVRSADPLEVELIEALGPTSRWPAKNTATFCLSADNKDEDNEPSPESDESGPNSEDREDLGGAGEAPGAAPGKLGGRGQRASRFAAAHIQREEQSVRASNSAE